MLLYPNIKLNLGLNVLRKRSDGFHDLETLFVPYFGICDELEIEKSESFSVEIPGIDWDPLKDLTVRAYELLRDDFALPPISIHLQKKTPVGAGLGGGSSDAAFTLKALNELFSLGLSQPRLAEYASRLGSDCAFFVYNCPMLGEGRGEVLEDFPLPSLESFRIEVVVPEGISVSTAQAYKGIVPHIPNKPLREILLQDPQTWKAELKNDFETTVFRQHPELALIKQKLYERGAIYASMSGSGSAIYGLFPH